jgi:hypothetical protein
LRKAAAKEKPGALELAALSRRLLAAVNPQVRVALTGIVYACFLSPMDLLVSEDLLFLRKHQFITLDSPIKATSIWTAPCLSPDLRAGGYLIGGFADFSVLAGTVSMSTSRQIDEAAKPFGAALIGSLRQTHWSALREAEFHVVSLKTRAAREWVLFAADSPGMRAALAEATLGLLSPSRRADLLRALPEHQWNTVWQTLTLSDLYFLGEEYLHRFAEDPVASPVLAALRSMVPKSEPERMRWLGSNPQPFSDCGHPHLMRLAPYEYYEGFMLPGRLAARTNEFKLYLAEFLDRRGLPAGIMSAVAEPLALQLLRSIKMTVPVDWESVLAAFSGLTDGMLAEVLDRK